MKRFLSGMLVLAAATFSVSCTNPMAKSDPNTIAEARHPDWSKLRRLVAEYESAKADHYARSLTVVQTQIQALVDGHSNDLIGEEALYYVGRIYYDMRDYHDARVTFNRHKDMFPGSQFGPTILALEGVMDKNDADYQRWLEESRSTISVR